MTKDILERINNRNNLFNKLFLLLKEVRRFYKLNIYKNEHMSRINLLSIHCENIKSYLKDIDLYNYDDVGKQYRFIIEWRDVDLINNKINDILQ